jgi:hypothetical protein
MLRNLKKRLRQMLEQGSTEEIVDLAAHQRRTLNVLVSLTFDRDPLVAWRAVEAMGAAAEQIAEDDPNGVRDHLRRLYWLMSEESGAICWRAPEAMGEIVRRQPDLFGDYIPIIVSLLREMADEDLEHFRAGILWAIGRLGSLAAGEIYAVLPAVKACLDHPDPQVRGMAVWSLGQCEHTELLADRGDLLADQALALVYESGNLDQVSVGELARRSLQAETG